MLTAAQIAGAILTLITASITLVFDLGQSTGQTVGMLGVGGLCLYFLASVIRQQSRIGAIVCTLCLAAIGLALVGVIKPTKWVEVVASIAAGSAFLVVTYFGRREPAQGLST